MIDHTRTPDAWCRRLSNSVRLHLNDNWIIYTPCCNIFNPNGQNSVLNADDLSKARLSAIDYVHSDRENICRNCVKKESRYNGRLSTRQLGNHVTQATRPGAK